MDSVFPAVAIAVIAALVLAWAWHGRQIDAHPVCRRCGHSLLGRTRLMLPECPECGADLSGARAVRIGRRRRRRPVIAASLLVIALCTAWVAVSNATQARGFDWAAHKPLGWVVGDADGRDPRARDAALSELARRVRSGELSRPREQALVEQALAYQADWKRPWAPGWGEIVEAAQAMGRLSEEQWMRYKVQSVTFAVGITNERVRGVKDLKVELVRGPDRISDRPAFRLELGVYAEPKLLLSGTSVSAAVERTDKELKSAAGAEVPAAGNAEPLAVLDVPGPITRGISRLARAETETDLPSLRPGPQTVRLPVVVRPLDLTWRGVRQRPRYDPASAERRLEVEARWELVPSDTLDELVGPELKGNWVPPSHRDAVIRAQAQRRDRKPDLGKQP